MPEDLRGGEMGVDFFADVDVDAHGSAHGMEAGGFVGRSGLE